MTKQRDLTLPEPPRGADRLKVIIAARIQRKIVSWAANGNLINASRADGSGLPYEVTSAEATSPDWLTTELRVVTSRGGIRRFTVRVTENM
jgi:hypothetical protein